MYAKKDRRDAIRSTESPPRNYGAKKKKNRREKTRRGAALAKLLLDRERRLRPAGFRQAPRRGAFALGHRSGGPHGFPPFCFPAPRPLFPALPSGHPVP